MTGLDTSRLSVDILHSTKDITSLPSDDAWWLKRPFVRNTSCNTSFNASCITPVAEESPIACLHDRGQPLGPVVGRRPQHAVSKLTDLRCPVPDRVLQYLYRSSLRLLAGLPRHRFLWYGLHVWWHVRSIGRLWGGWYVLPRTTPFSQDYSIFSYCWLFLSSPWPKYWSINNCRAYTCAVEHISFHLCSLRAA